MQALAVLALPILALHSYLMNRENKRRNAVEGPVSQTIQLFT